MTYTEWEEAHKKKRDGVLSRLTHLSAKEVEEYFLYRNMSINEPDFCGLYKDNKKCHDIEDLNCFLCGCPFFIYEDKGLFVEGGVTTYSTCSINAKEGSQFLSGNSVHQDCTNCTIPHHGKLPLITIKELDK